MQLFMSTYNNFVRKKYYWPVYSFLIQMHTIYMNSQTWQNKRNFVIYDLPLFWMDSCCFDYMKCYHERCFYFCWFSFSRSILDLWVFILLMISSDSFFLYFWFLVLIKKIKLSLVNFSVFLVQLKVQRFFHISIF